jgi:hypothetical protein
MHGGSLITRGDVFGLKAGIIDLQHLGDSHQCLIFA